MCEGSVPADEVTGTPRRLVFQRVPSLPSFPSPTRPGKQDDVSPIPTSPRSSDKTRERRSRDPWAGFEKY